MRCPSEGGGRPTSDAGDAVAASKEPHAKVQARRHRPRQGQVPVHGRAARHLGRVERGRAAAPSGATVGVVPRTAGREPGAASGAFGRLVT